MIRTWLIANLEIIGFAAAMLGTISLMPQVIKTWRSKSVSGVSLMMYVIIAIDSMLWLTYGLVLSLPPLITQSTIVLSCACAMVAMKLLWK